MIDNKTQYSHLKSLSVFEKTTGAKNVIVKPRIMNWMKSR